MMDGGVLYRTMVPVLLLVGAGALSRAAGVLREGDGRVLNAYLYWFALPALFLADLPELSFGSENHRFVAAGILPLLAALALLAAAAALLRLPRGVFTLLAVSTVFGSLAFFGIPFIVFAIPGPEAERTATLAAATISLVAVTVTMALLEVHRLGGEAGRVWTGIIARRLAANPLVLSILAGTGLAAAGVRLPEPLSRPLHLLGGTTATVAFFMLGVVLYGRRYTRLGAAAGLALLRLALLPLLGLASARLFGLEGLERTTVVLMQGMPVAVSMLVLSERYAFHPELVASLILVSSVGAAVSLPLWLAFLGP